MTEVLAMRPKVGVAVLVWRAGRVLLLRRQGSHGAGTWACPGGHLEYGEEPAICGARELLEETGLQAGTLRFRAITNDVFAEEAKHYITIWFDADDSTGEPFIAAPRECSELGWFTWDALPAPLFLPLENLRAGKGEGDEMTR